jgi:hypothetical protein
VKFMSDNVTYNVPLHSHYSFFAIAHINHCQNRWRQTQFQNQEGKTPEKRSIRITRAFRWSAVGMDSQDRGWPVLVATLLWASVLLQSIAEAKIDPARWETIDEQMASNGLAINQDSCDALSTCSPAACTVNDALAVCSVAPTSTIGWAAQVKSLSCKICTESRVSTCENLASVLRTDAGVKAAYCNEDFLVIWATGMPRYEVQGNGDYLDTIPSLDGDTPRRAYREVGGRTSTNTSTNQEPEGQDKTAKEGTKESQSKRGTTDECRTEVGSEKLNVYKIPLFPVEQTPETPNIIPTPHAGVPGLPAESAIGVAVDGTPIFPSFNDNGAHVWENCGVSPNKRIEEIGACLRSCMCPPPPLPI